MVATFSMTEIAVKTKFGCCRDWALLVFYRMALMVLGTKAIGDLEIAFTRGRRVVHRTQILVGESTRCSLVFWETTELLVKFDIAKRAAGRVAVGGPKFSSLN